MRIKPLPYNSRYNGRPPHHKQRDFQLCGGVRARGDSHDELQRRVLGVSPQVFRSPPNANSTQSARPGTRRANSSILAYSAWSNAASPNA